MSGVDVRISRRQLRDVERMLRDVPRGIERALSGAINDTARMQQTSVSQKIRERVNIKKRDIDPHIGRTKANAKKLSATITLSESERLSLKRFGAKVTRGAGRPRKDGQTSRRGKGVSYKIEKTGKRQRIADAFGPDTPRLGGHVWKRLGSSRLPITKLHGPSPWGVFVKSGIQPEVLSDTQQTLNRKVDERVRFVLLKHRGKI